MHITLLIDAIRPAFSGETAKRYTAEIARHHRIQASPGYRDAAEWLAMTLRENGLEVTMESYPANAQTRFWVLPSFQEWDCRTATLDWLKEGGTERLCDYRATALSIVQRSDSVDGEFDVVDVGDGTAADYDAVDVTGKVVLSRAAPRNIYQSAVVERGAAGVLFDHIDPTAPGRNRVDLPDARQYSSFWWQPGQPKSWGFVLTPRQGDSLRARLAAGEQVRVRARIEARFYDGAFEAVWATIPGTGDGAVLGIAHLCHPQGFANDNASGVACLLETAATLNRLIESGQLPRPPRTIHFLWIPEMTGTYAWLSAHEDLIPGIVAGINLDMVGQRQETTGSVMTLEHPPESLPSFAPDLLERLRAEMLDEQPSHSGHGGYALFRYASTPFSGGSDHLITSDPTVGIPTPMFIQWPDRFYHTTADTMEHVDAKSLWRAGTLAASYLYWLAGAQEEETRWLGWEMVSRYSANFSRQLQDESTQLLEMGEEQVQANAWDQIQHRANYRRQLAQTALDSLAKLASVSENLPAWRQEIDEASSQALQRCRQLVRADRLPAISDDDSPSLPLGDTIPERLYRGPIMDMGLPHPPLPSSDEDAARWQSLFKQTPNWGTLRSQAEFWADGKRTLAEIADLVEMETGHKLGPQIADYFAILARLGLMRLHKNKNG
ncbi:MAG: DUF4910 domain-containing protein [Caldilineales bacterium]|nr:DUF4910 domain-containing protein [Caldilineales bacterium]